MRPAPDDAPSIHSACYPLVPFGNSIRDNRFTFDGQDYALIPKTDWDKHDPHGEGWLDDWTVVQAEAQELPLGHAHDGNALPCTYRAEQRFEVAEDRFTLTLRVTNTGSRPMPFGLGWHPYFPMTPQTRLRTQTGRMWTEQDGWLPGNPGPVPGDLDFPTPAPLPHHWVNNGFEDWSGTARITWPERGGARTNPIMHFPAGPMKFLARDTYLAMHQTEPQLDGRGPIVPQGKVLGGGSAVNAMVYMRGQPADYADWNTALRGLGDTDPGWGWEDLLPHYTAQEDNDSLGGASHGTSGPLKVSHLGHTSEMTARLHENPAGHGRALHP